MKNFFDAVSVLYVRVEKKEKSWNWSGASRERDLGRKGVMVG